MNSDGNQYRGISDNGTGFGSTKIISDKVFRVFCLIVWMLLCIWSYLVQGVQKAVQNRIFFERIFRLHRMIIVAEARLQPESRQKKSNYKLVSRGESKLFVKPTLPGRKHTVSFS